MIQPSQASGHLQSPGKKMESKKQRSALNTKQTMLERHKRKKNYEYVLIYSIVLSYLVLEVSFRTG